jgi:hypothetical protein
LKHAGERSEMLLRLFNRVKTDLVRHVIRMIECVAVMAQWWISQGSVGVHPGFTASLIEHRDRYRLSEWETAYITGAM